MFTCGLLLDGPRLSEQASPDRQICSILSVFPTWPRYVHHHEMRRFMQFPTKILAFVAALSIYMLPVGFAQDQLKRSGGYAPSLGDVMTIIQLRHAKVWYAAKLSNWPLAKYEFDHLVSALQNVARFGPELAFDLANETDPLANAIAAMDDEAFDRAFGNMTEGCNSCHVKADVGFIVIRTPTRFSPYSNQIFER